MKISKSSPDLWTKLPEYTLIRTLTTHLYSTRACLILLQCYNASYFLCSLNITCVSDCLQIYVMQSRHFHLLRLHWATVLNSGNSKACLIDRSKKEKKTLHDLTCHATYSASTHENCGCLPLCQCKDSWNFGRFFRPEYLGSPMEVVQLFRSTKLFWLFHFWQTGSSLLYFSSLI